MVVEIVLRPSEFFAINVYFPLSARHCKKIVRNISIILKLNGPFHSVQHVSVAEGQWSSTYSQAWISRNGKICLWTDEKVKMLQGYKGVFLAPHGNIIPQQLPAALVLMIFLLH